MKKPSAFRAPAIPLVAVDPYFSIWSDSDRLPDDATRHWTGCPHPLTGHIFIDGELYRFLGDPTCHSGRNYMPYPAMPQKKVAVRPLTTVYTFAAGGVRLTLSFMTPLLPDDLMLMSRPVSYVSYRLEALDGATHNVMLFFDAEAGLATNGGYEEVTLGKTDFSLTASMGTEKMLKNCGDDRRIDWGTFHLIAPGFRTGLYRQINRMGMFNSLLCSSGEIYAKEARPTELPSEREIASGTKLAVGDAFPLLCADKKIVLEGRDEGFFCLGYDDVKSIRYFGEQIEAYWRQDGDSFETVAGKAVADYDSIVKRADAFDKSLMRRAEKLSPRYRDIVSLAYRQSVAAHKLTWHDGELQFFSKENFSNGCIATVDVTYPSIPLFLLYEPRLVEGMLNPIFKMIDKGLWHYDFAPHDVGTYPIADGQVYGMNLPDPLVRQMPVEECGNILIAVAAVCRAEKDASYFQKHFDVLKKWADYLISYGFDPDNQLCTDDFAGHLAHNANLSAKGILGLASFAMLCRMAGRDGEQYLAAAKKNAAAWVNAAADGDHTRLAFDRPDSWSIKYNLVWDKLFGFGLFPEEVYKREIAYYKTRMHPYGLPLDCRSDYTKSDWQMWSTVLDADDKAYFDIICDAMWRYLCETPDRNPFTDWYYTTEARQRGFQARSVQGGLFLPLLKF